jgi:hypothetical protein
LVVVVVRVLFDALVELLVLSVALAPLFAARRLPLAPLRSALSLNDPFVERFELSELFVLSVAVPPLLEASRPLEAMLLSVRVVVGLYDPFVDELLEVPPLFAAYAPPAELLLEASVLVVVVTGLFEPLVDELLDVPPLLAA